MEVLVTKGDLRIEGSMTLAEFQEFCGMGVKEMPEVVMSETIPVFDNDKAKKTRKKKSEKRPAKSDGKGSGHKIVWTTELDIRLITELKNGSVKDASKAMGISIGPIRKRMIVLKNAGRM